MRTSEPKPHEINKLLVSYDSEVRKRECRRNDANFGIGTLAFTNLYMTEKPSKHGSPTMAVMLPTHRSKEKPDDRHTDSRAGAPRPAAAPPRPHHLGPHAG